MDATTLPPPAPTSWRGAALRWSRRPAVARWLRRAGIALAALLVLWAAAWIAVPPLVRWQAQKQLTAMLGRAVTIADVDFAPWSLELTLHDLAVAGRQADATPLLRVQRLHVDGDWRSFFRLAPVIAALDVDAPRLSLARTAAGHYDVDDVLQRLAGRGDAGGEPARYAAHNVRVRDGTIRFDDRPSGAAMKSTACCSRCRSCPACPRWSTWRSSRAWPSRWTARASTPAPPARPTRRATPRR